MRSKFGSMHSRGLLTAFWALLTVASLTLIIMGLWRSTFFIYAPEPALVEKARVGALYIFAGSIASGAAAGMSVILIHPRWIWAFVAAPAVLVGGYELVDPTSLLRVLAAAVAFPFAVMGLYWGLRYVRQREVG